MAKTYRPTRRDMPCDHVKAEDGVFVKCCQQIAHDGPHQTPKEAAARG